MRLMNSKILKMRKDVSFSLTRAALILGVAMSAGCSGEGDTPVSNSSTAATATATAPTSSPSTAPTPAPAPAAAACVAKPDHRVLYLGNSQMAVWDMPTLVHSVADSAPSPCPKIGGDLVDGTNLRELWLDGKAAAAIRSGRYDTVVLSESIDLIYPGATGYPAAFKTYATAFIDLARSVGVEPVLYASPSVISSAMVEEFNAMAAPQLALGQELHVKVAAAGLAWLRAWREQPNLVLHASDAAHPGFMGSYLSSLMVYATINDASPQGLTNTPVTDCNIGPCVPISASQAAQLQRVAWEAYQSTRLP
jgi:hypothetical protein